MPLVQCTAAEAATLRDPASVSLLATRMAIAARITFHTVQMHCFKSWYLQAMTAPARHTVADPTMHRSLASATRRACGTAAAARTTLPLALLTPRR